MRPSKLRLPDSTAATTRSFSSIAFATGASSGPLLPMQVVQPYPARAKPSFSSGSSKPAPRRYSVTAFEPGARLVLTVGGTASPRATALRASNPAATMTVGLDVLVQLVIAAMATEPFEMPTVRPAASTGTLG